MENSETSNTATHQKQKFSSIKEEIEFRVGNRITTDEEFDIHSALRELLEKFGLSPEDTGGDIIFEGKDPIVPSTIKFASASALGLTAKAVAIAKLWKYRTGESQDIKVDLRRVIHRLSPFFQGKWEKLNSFSPGFPTEISSPFSPHFYKTKDDRHVMPLDFYNRLRISTLKFLNVPEDKDAIAGAILKWNSDELEEKANAEGLVLTKLRSVQEFLATAQFEVLEKLSIIQIEKIGESDPVPFTSDPSTPLEGIRALGMGHVIAGAGTGRGLALHGADVLNIWSLTDVEMESLYATADVGMRSAKLDLKSIEGKATMDGLIKTADIFFANRRVGYLEKYGLSANDMAKIRPGIIHATVSLFGQEGPWASHSGFDVSAGVATGIMALEGTLENPQLPSIMVVDDYLVAWLLTTAIIATLVRRAEEGGSYKIHCSLSRTVLWMYQLGVFDKEFATSIAGKSPGHEFVDPELFTADTPMGKYQGLTEQVFMSKTPGHYKYALLPRGASDPVWEK
ncbi:CoA transferase family III [Mucilaginibacter frigoritolerans]|uniref:CoA transferase family III n=1 Tax=Mucilaginibacter frigoritolerans TaxID=652788 RepID=A0A562TVG2_9SPHI|nr:CoA transferase [Mucilaginibacter frigoritolerans]TWI97552.1 CoA transferase family III [Mucilaginibacter frigoritolerans]